MHFYCVLSPNPVLSAHRVICTVPSFCRAHGDVTHGVREELSITCSDYLLDDHHRVNTGSAFVRI
jgi:hypothetical protein